MADTRKDKRAPISLKVRFKSATLDEFIEQYSVDISRGGIFIKSKTPMSVGTLLKFEFQLKDESRLIHGVGRVVWKREGGDKETPPGMGIKFIKMDPDSRALVEKMAQGRGDAPGRFEEGADPPPKKKPSSGGFFPDTTPEDELPPPEDRTQVRHASEFLASALADGGSDSASEAETRAEEARKRSEDIERKRAEAKKKRRKPRIKKTLVGMGLPTGGSDEDVKEALAKLDAEAADQAAAQEAEGAKGSLLDAVTDSAETLAMDREAVDEQAAEAPAPEEKKDEKKEEPEEKPAAAADAKEAEPKEKAEAKEPEPEKPEKPEEKVAAKESKPEEKPKAKAREPKKKPKPEEKAKAREPKKKPKPERSARPKPVQVATSKEEEPKGRAGMIFFALIALAAIGVLVWMQLRQRDETTLTDVDTVGETVGETVAEEPDAGEELVVEDVPEPVIETVTVGISVTPAEATIFVDDVEQDVGAEEVDLPLGQEATISARLAGYVEALTVVTAVEGQEALTLTLEAMPWVIAVTTTPEGARVRAGRSRATGPGEIELSGAPTEAVSLSATLRNHEAATETVEVSAFQEVAGRMVANVTITLTERVRPTGGGGRRRGGGDTGGGDTGGGDTGGGDTGGGDTGGGDTGDTGGGDTGDTGGGDTGDTGGGDTGGGDTGDTGDTGGGGDTAPPPPPDNPFG